MNNIDKIHNTLQSKLGYKGTVEDLSKYLESPDNVSKVVKTLNEKVGYKGTVDDFNSYVGIQVPKVEGIQKVSAPSVTVGAPEVNVMSPLASNVPTAPKVDWTAQEEGSITKPIGGELEREQPVNFEGMTPDPKNNPDYSVTNQSGKFVYTFDKEKSERRKEKEAFLTILDEQMKESNKQLKFSMEAVKQYSEENPTSGWENFPVAYSGAIFAQHKVEELKAKGFGTQGDIYATQSILKDAEQAFKAPKKNENWAKSFGQGGAETITDPDAWLFGILSLNEVQQSMYVFEKVERGESLTSSESALMDAMLTRTQAEAMRSGDTSNWYKGGKIAGEALPFMRDMAMTGGLGTITTAGGKGAVSLAQKATAKYLRKKAEKQLLKEGIDITEDILSRRAADLFMRTAKVADYSGRVLSASTVTPAARLPLMPTSYSGVAKNIQPKVVGDEFGTYQIQEGDDFGTAVGKQFVEVQSEGVGEFFAPILKGVKLLGGKAIPKIISDSKFGQVGSKVVDAIMLDNPYLQKAGVSGIAGEVGEEIFGQTEQYLSGLTTKEDLDNFYSGDNFKSMLIGFAPMSALGMAGNAINYGSNEVQYRRAKKELGGITDELDNSSVGELGNKISDVLIQNNAFDQDGNLTEEGRQLNNNLVSYAQRKMAKDIANDGKQENPNSKYYDFLLNDRSKKWLESYLADNDLTAPMYFNLAYKATLHENELTNYERKTLSELDRAFNGYLKAEDTAQQASAEIDTQVNPTNNKIQNVMVGGQPHMVKGGNIVMTENEEGKVILDKENSDQVITVVNAEGIPSQIGIEQLESVVGEVDAEEAKNAAIESAHTTAYNETFYPVGSIVYRKDAQGQFSAIKETGANGFTINSVTEGGEAVPTLIENTNSENFGVISLKAGDKYTLNDGTQLDIISNEDGVISASVNGQPSEQTTADELATLFESTGIDLTQFEPSEEDVTETEVQEAEKVESEQSAPTETQITSNIKPGVAELFESNPELANIGTPEQYSQYLNTIFPNSKLKDIVYHGTDNKFDKFDENFVGTKTDNGTIGRGFYVSKSNDESRIYGNPISVIVNIDKTIDLNEDKNIKIATSDNISNDAVNNGYDSSKLFNTYVLYKSNQIHILGSKQDIEGFKEFVKGTQETQQVQETEAPEVYPTDKKGEPIFEQMPVEQSIKVVREVLGDDAVNFVEDKLKAANKAVKTVAKKAPKSTSLLGRKSEVEAIALEKQKATESLDYWTNVKRLMSEEAIQATREQAPINQVVENPNQVGQVIIDRYESAKKVIGNPATITAPNGEVLKGRYVLVSAYSVTPSHNPFDGYNTSEGFPLNADGSNTNQRDYKNDKANQVVTEGIANSFGGQALESVPKVSKDGVVLDGNGRTIASQLAAANGTDKAYLEALNNNAANYGFTAADLKSISNPRIVFELETELPYTTEAFAMFNSEEKKSESATASAVAKSKQLSPSSVAKIAALVDSYSSLESFFSSETATAEMVKTLVDAKVINTLEIAKLIDNGLFSATGRELITNVLLGATLNEQAIRQIGNDSSLKGIIIRAMKQILENAKLKEYSLFEDINNAIGLMYEARKAKMSVSDFLLQTNMFEKGASERFSDFEQMLALAMSDSGVLFKGTIDKYNTVAAPLVGGQVDMFTGRILDPNEVKQQIIEYYGKTKSIINPNAGVDGRNRGSETTRTDSGRISLESAQAKFDAATTVEEKHKAALEITLILDEQNNTKTIVAKDNEDFISMLPAEWSEIIRVKVVAGVFFKGNVIINAEKVDTGEELTLVYEHEYAHKANRNVHSSDELVELWNNSTDKKILPRDYLGSADNVKGDELIAHIIEDIIQKQGYENYKNGNIDLSLYSQQEQLKKTIDYANKEYLRNARGGNSRGNLYEDKNARKGNENLQQTDEGRQTPRFRRKDQGELTEVKRNVQGDVSQGSSRVLQPVTTETLLIDGVERPTRNSNGAYIHSTEEGVRNFYAWFSNSKVLDNQGRPLVVYHFSNESFNSFDRKTGINTHLFSTEVVNREAFFFTTDIDFSSQYGSKKHEVYLKINKIFDFNKHYYYKGISPITTDFFDEIIDNIEENGVDMTMEYQSYRGELKIKPEYNWKFFDGEIGKLFVDYLKKNGSDGVYFIEEDSPIYAVFNPTQIKSATDNTGEFSENNTDIRFKIAKSQEELDDFVKDSKVKETVYHATSAEFDEFDISKSANGTIWFSTDKESTLDKQQSGKEATRIIEAKINLKNPAGWDEYEKYSIDELIREGYDGAILDEDAFVFSPEQVLIRPTDNANKPRFSIKEEAPIIQDVTDTQIQVNGRWYAKGIFKELPENPRVGDVVKELNPETDISKSKRVIEEVVSYFGTTDDFNEVGYLTTDGKMIDFSGKRFGAVGGRRQMDHREIADVEITDMVDFMGYGNIRMKPESNGFEITKLPTSAQLRALKQYIRTLKEGVFVDFSKPGIYGIEFSKEYPKNTNVDRIINDIIRYYNEGIKPVDIGLRFSIKPLVSEIGFYSTVEKALNAIQQEKGTKEQFQKMLLNNGAKQAEMDWMGFDELPEKLTKADIQNWIDENRIEVEEVQKGNYSNRNLEAVKVEPFVYNVVDTKNGEVVLSNVSQSRADEFIDNAHDGTNTKFSQYVLPGGENYKELLLTMPGKPFFTNQTVNIKVNDEWLDTRGAKEKLGIDDISNIQTGDRVNGHFIDGTKQNNKETNSNFRSSHFDEPNILAHIRFDERTVNGERVLFVEEFQSDWAQKGKKEGFRKPVTQNQVDSANKKMHDLIQKGNQFQIDNANWEDDDSGYWEISKQIDNAISEHYELDKQLTNPNVPDMPFKKTDQWVNLAARRMMRYAAENGFDRLAWTNGTQQADRYDLSKQVDKVAYSKTQLGKIEISVRNKNMAGRTGEWKFVGEYTQQELPDIVGKDLAEKISKDSETKNKKEYSGVDLKVGGEGMKAFYDAIVPSAMNKLGKPFGAKVETIEIPETGTQQSIPVTESMKETVMEGIPLFKISGEQKETKLPDTIDVDGTQRHTTNSNGKQIHSTEEGIRNFWRWFGDSKVVDEQGRPLVVYHTTNNEFTSFDIKKSKEGFFFSPNKERLSVYNKSKTEAFYLSIDNPSHELFKSDINYLKGKGYNGIMDYGHARKVNKDLYEIVAFNPEQIKSATGNLGTFDPNNADIRFAILGEQGATALDKAEEATTRLDNLRVAKEMEKGGKEYGLVKKLLIAQNYSDAAKQVDMYPDDLHYKQINKIFDKYDDIRKIKDDLYWEKSKYIIDAAKEAGKQGVEVFLSEDDKGNDVIYFEMPFGQISFHIQGENWINKLPKSVKIENHKWNGEKNTGVLLRDNLTKQYNPQEIRLATGWEKGVDGKWRYEILDVDTTKLEEKLEKNKDNYNEGTGVATYLGEYVDAESELFKAYPELKNVDLIISVLESNNDSAFYQDAKEETDTEFGNSPLIDIKASSIDNVKSLLVHELEHAVQSIEGFAKGGSSLMFKQVLKGLNEQIDEYNIKLSEASRNNDNVLYEKLMEEKLSLIPRINKLQGKYGMNEGTYDEYKALAGETEARNAQTRMNYTSEERLNKLLSETADVAPQDQIVIMDALGAMNLENSPTDLETIKQQAITDGTFMKAPNGRPTNLNERQWLQTRTPDFKAWFGNWINDAENASKVVDDNGEPLVVYHGTDNNFNSFDKISIGEFNYFGDGFYFTSNKDRANEYGKNTIEAYLSIKNPFYFYGQTLKNGINKEVEENSYDGVIVDDEKIVFSPSQIKSATGNDGSFGADNADIRFSIKAPKFDSATQSKLDAIEKKYNETEYKASAIEFGISDKGNTFGTALDKNVHHELIAEYLKEGFNGLGYTYKTGSEPIIYHAKSGTIYVKAAGREIRISDHIGRGGIFTPTNDIYNLNQAKEILAKTKTYKEVEASDKLNREKSKAEHDILVAFNDELKERGLGYKVNNRTYQSIEEFIQGKNGIIDIKTTVLNNGAFRYEYLAPIDAYTSFAPKSYMDWYNSSDDPRFSIKAPKFESGASLKEMVTTSNMFIAARADKYGAKGRRMVESEIKTVGRAISEQTANLKESANLVTDMVKALLNNGSMNNMTRAELSQILTNVRNASNKKDLTKEFDKISSIARQIQLRNAKRRFNDLMKFKVQDKNAKGISIASTVDDETVSIITTIRKSLKELTLEDVENQINEINNLDEKTTSDETKLVGLGIARDYMNEIKTREAQLSELSEELSKAKDDLVGKEGKNRLTGTQLVNSIEVQISQVKSEMTSAYDDLSARLNKIIAEGKEALKNIKLQDKERVATLSHFVNSDMKGIEPKNNPEKGRNFKQWLKSNLIISPLQSFDFILRSLAPNQVAGNGYLHDHFSRGILSASQNAYEGTEQAFKMIDEAVAKIFGNKFTFRYISARDFKKMSKYELTYGTEKSSTTITATNGQLAYVYAVNKMTDGAMKLRAMGISEEQVEEMKAALPVRIVKLVDAIQDEILPKLRVKYNNAHLELFNTSMASIENYFPLHIDKTALTQKVDLEEESNKLSGLIKNSTKSIIKRTVNTKPIDIRNSDFSDILTDHIKDMEQWAAFASIRRDMNTLLSNRNFLNRLIELGGFEYMVQFKRAAAIAVDVYQPLSDSYDTAITGVSRNFATSKVVLNPYTALKQVLSIVAYLTEPSPKFQGKVLVNLAKGHASFKWAMDNLPDFRKRWESSALGDEKLSRQFANIASEGDFVKFMDASQKVVQKYGMYPNKMVDSYICSVGAKALYETNYDKYIAMGATEEKARERALVDAVNLYNTTQQSSESMFLSGVQLDRTFFSTAYTVFNNASLAYNRHVFDAARNLKNAFNNRANLIENRTKFNMRTFNVSEEASKKAATKEVDIQIMRDVLRLAVFGYGVQFVWRLGSQFPYLLFGDDDDKKKKIVKEAATGGALITPVRGLLFGATFEAVIDGLMDWLNTGNSYAFVNRLTGNIHPIISDVDQLARAAVSKTMTSAKAGYLLLNLGAKLGWGIDLKPFANFTYGFVELMDSDELTANDVLIDIMSMLSVPQSQLKALALDNPETFFDRYIELKELVDYGLLAPILELNPDDLDNYITSGRRYMSREMKEKVEK